MKLTSNRMDTLALIDGEKNLLSLSIEKKQAYSYIHKLVKEAEIVGVVKIKKNGREIIPSLTRKGKQVFNLWNKLYLLINEEQKQ